MESDEHNSGFTIVELLIVIVIIGILAAVTTATLLGTQNRAKTARSISTYEQIRNKTSIWNTLYENYPDLAQLRTNSLSPTDIDTAGGVTGQKETKLSSKEIVIGATLNQVRADSGATVYYEPCWNGFKLSGGTVIYWDFSTSSTVSKGVGVCP